MSSYIYKIKCSLLLLQLFYCIIHSLKLSTSNTQKNYQRLSTTSLEVTTAKGISSANLDWPNLGFEYRQTDSFVQCIYRNGAWQDIELIRSDSPYIKIHIGATALHYGQACFEGLKAFQTKDKKVKIFRPQVFETKTYFGHYYYHYKL